MERRKFLYTSGVAITTIGLAGCNTTDNEGTPSKTSDTPSDTPDEDGETEERGPERFENIIPEKETNSGYRELSNSDWGRCRGGRLRYGSTGNVGVASLYPEIRWSSKREEGSEAFYETEPIVVENYVFVTSKEAGDFVLYAFDEKTGDILWEKEGYGTKMTPIYVDELLYVTGKEDNLLVGIEPTTGDIVETVSLPSEMDYIPEFIGAGVIYQGVFYGVTRSHIYSISMEAGELNWKQTPLDGRRAENRNAGVDRDNRWSTDIIFSEEQGMLLCGDSTGFVYALDIGSEEVLWIMALAGGDDVKSVSGTEIYDGKDFYTGVVPTIYDGKVIFEIGSRGLDLNGSDKNSIIYANDATGEIQKKEVTVEDGGEVATLEGRFIPERFDSIMEFNPNYLTIDGNRIYFSQNGTVGMLNTKTGETFSTPSGHSDTGAVISIVVGSEKLFAIEYHTYDEGDVTTVFAVDKKSGKLLWSGETPTQVRHLAIANETIYACGADMYAIQANPRQSK